MSAVQATLQPNFFFSFVLVVSYKTFKLGFGSFLFLQKYYKYSLEKGENMKSQCFCERFVRIITFYPRSEIVGLHSLM